MKLRPGSYENFRLYLRNFVIAEGARKFENFPKIREGISSRVWHNVHHSAT